MSYLLRSLEKAIEEMRSTKLGVRVGVKLDDIICSIQKGGGKQKFTHGHKFPKFDWNRRCSCCGDFVWGRVGRIRWSDTNLVDFFWCDIDGTRRWV